jgi:diguanylate cyclase (GGDEF)-like protein/PAS domain S-box-containing protein
MVDILPSAGNLLPGADGVRWPPQSSKLVGGIVPMSPVGSFPTRSRQRFLLGRARPLRPQRFSSVAHFPRNRPARDYDQATVSVLKLKIAEQLAVSPRVTPGPAEVASTAFLERNIALVRLLAVSVVVSIGLVLPSPLPAAVLGSALALGVSSAAVLHLFRTAPDRLARTAMRMLIFAIDAAVGGVLVTAYSWPGYLTWVTFILVIISGAARWQLRGALAGYLLFVIVDVPAELTRPGIAPVLTSLQVILGSSAFKVGLMGVGAGFFGLQGWKSDRSRRQLAAVAAESEQRAHELAFSERRLRSMLDSVADGILTIDPIGLIESANPATERLFGDTADRLVGQHLTTLVSDGTDQGFAAYLQRFLATEPDARYAATREAVGRRRDGSTFPLEFRLNEMVAGGRRVVVCNLRDMSERKAHLERLEYQALHDGLTGLANRSLFRDRLRHAIVMNQRHGSIVGLLILDLNQFKEINDTLGHHNGDRLLQQVAQRIAAELRESDTVARLGGDEFAILVPDQDDGAASAMIAQRLLKALVKPFLLEGHAVEVGGSIGIAICPKHGDDVDLLIRHADVAMYDAKRERSGYAVYSPDRDHNNAAHFKIVGELRHAITRGEFVLHYQPKVSLKLGVAVGAEALVRWRHPSGELIYPDQFIPAAEASELMWPVTEVVLLTALQQWRVWHQMGLDMTVSVNLSADNLRDRGLGRRVGQLLDSQGVPASALTLEITESSLMAEGAEKTLSVLVDMGVGLAADDFGTGYSSLAHLKRLTLTELKIDRSFVQRMDQDPDDAAIVRPTIDLGHNLGLIVAAEGVENELCLAMLKSFGCDLAQGYLIGRPMPAPEFLAWLEQSQWAPLPAQARVAGASAGS